MVTAAMVLIWFIGASAALNQIEIAPEIVNGLFYAVLAIIAGVALVSIGGPADEECIPPEPLSAESPPLSVLSDVTGAESAGSSRAHARRLETWRRTPKEGSLFPEALLQDEGGAAKAISSDRQSSQASGTVGLRLYPESGRPPRA